MNRINAVLGAILVLAACTKESTPTDEAALAANDGNGGFEVWLVDQSNSNGLAYGGTIYVYDGPDLRRGGAQPAPGVIDLAGATNTLCVASTGASPVRPHMVFFNASHTHAVLSFVASGHVVVFDADTRAPVTCLRTSPGAGGARQAHAAIPAPDDSYILVANQNGKLLERIDANFATNQFAFDPTATINLATCTTPSGAPCESPALRPDNAPICPIIDATNSLSFVTLRGGGLVVVDAKAAPMRIVAEYDRTVVHGNGCGGIEVQGQMYVNSGGGTAGNMTEFDVYRFPISAFSATNAANTPAPVNVFTDDVAHRDAHGMTVSQNRQFLWVIDRGAHLVEVFDTKTDARLDNISMMAPNGVHPTPDLADNSPGGDLVFISLRGPTPLSGDPHVSTGVVPGMAIMHVEAGGRRARVREIIPISNKDAAGVERADAHGLRVRRK